MAWMVRPLAVPRGLLVLCLSTLPLGCDENLERPERTRPWQAGSEQHVTTKSERRELVVAPASFLNFAVPGKEANPQGRIELEEGRLSTDLEDLGQTRGRLTFALRTLSLFDAGELAPTWTQTAQEWLGPTKDVRNNQASFELAALHRLSSSKARRGERLSGGAKESYRVRATTVGRLTLRGFAVDHSFPIVLEFEFGAKSGPLEEVRVRLERDVAIPLLEHGIEPRDGAGVQLPQARELVGRVIGSRILVGGELRLIPLSPEEPLAESPDPR